MIPKQLKLQHFEYKGVSKHVDFPLYIFPEKIENIINKLHDSAGFEKSVSAASILFTVSTLLGNSKSIKVKTVWVDTPNIWIAIIGKRGSMKTPTINFGISPLKRDETEFSNTFDNEIMEWNKLDKDTKAKTIRPKRIQRFSNDVTVEGLIKAMKENPNGMGIFKDELNGFFEELNRYKTGGNLEFYLSAFSGGMYTKNRASYDAITIDNIFLSIIGSVQPQVLKQISTNNTVNGMIDRWLFVESNDDVYEFDFTDIDPQFVNEYHDFYSIIKDHSFTKSEMEWNDDSLSTFKEGMNAIESIMTDDTTSDQIFTYLSKMKTYFARFCVLIPVMYNTMKIEKYHVEYAFKLTTFFIDTALATFLGFENNTNIENIFKEENANTQKQKVIAISKHLPGISVTEIAKLVGCSRSYASTTVNKC